MATLTFTLWAFIGVESASVSAGVVENPSRNVPIATVGGVILASVAYVLSSSVIMGMIPNKALIASSAPFADAAQIALGPWVGSIVAFCAAVGCLGSLGGWTLLVGQTAKAAADDGLFPGIFARVNSKNVPATGLAIVAAIMSIQVVATMSPTASDQFGKIASVAVIMTLLPYIYSCIAIKVLGYKKMPDGQYTFFVLTALVGSDGDQTRWSLIFVVSTIVFYSISVTRKRHIAEAHLHPGGASTPLVLWFSMGAVILALAAMFYVSVGGKELRTREPPPPTAVTASTALAPAT
jgi:arginine:agmatine antiporter